MPLLAPGPQARPGTPHPRAAHPGPPHPGLLAPGHLPRGCSPRGLLARGYSSQDHPARGCSPRASSPGATRPGTPGPGLLARSLLTRGCSPLASSNGAVPYIGSSCLKPLPLHERNGSEYPTQPPDHGVSAVKCTGKVAEVGDTESQAAPPAAMQRAQNPKQTYA